MLTGSVWIRKAEKVVQYEYDYEPSLPSIFPS